MKKIILIVGILILNGCAGRTVHQYCQENIGSYKDYDQCYSEVSASGGNRSMASKFFTGFSKGYNDSQSNTVSCTSMVNGNLVQTNCN